MIIYLFLLPGRSRSFCSIGGSDLVFIVLDGLDTSGKSTQAKLLATYFKKQGKTCLIRSHPSDDNWFGSKGRQYLLVEGRKAHLSASLFYLIDVIRSLILFRWRRFDYIIFVRYLMGTAYLPPPLHKLGYLFFSKIVPSSNLMFYIRISPKEAMRRIALNRQRKERFETSSELIRVSSKAFSLLNFGSWIVIDGDRSINQVHDEIISRITHFTNPIWSMH